MKVTFDEKVYELVAGQPYDCCGGCDIYGTHCESVGTECFEFVDGMTGTQKIWKLVQE